MAMQSLFKNLGLMNMISCKFFVISKKKYRQAPSLNLFTDVMQTTYIHISIFHFQNCLFRTVQSLESFEYEIPM